MNAHEKCHEHCSDERETDNLKHQQHLFDIIPSPIFLKNTSEVYTYCNKAFEATLGIPRNKIIGSTIYDIAPKNLADLCHAMDRQLLDNPGEQTYEVQVEHGDGTLHDTVFRNATFTDDSGVVIGIVGFMLDISTICRSEIPVLKYEKEYLELIDNVNEAIVIAQDAKLEFVNNKLSKLLGLPVDALLGRTIIDFVWPEDREIVYSNHQKRLNGEHVPDIYEFRVLSSGGEERWVRLSAALIKWKGRPATLSVLEDITELKMLMQSLQEKNASLQAMKNQVDAVNEEILKAYNKLKMAQSCVVQTEKMACIGQLAAGVAHEINNPIGFITSNLCTLGNYLNRVANYLDEIDSVISLLPPETARDILAHRSTQKIDYILADINNLIAESIEGANRVKKIVQDLKSFSRQDGPDFSYADINECIESTVNIIWNEIKYKAELIKELGDLPRVMCNPRQLNQVFMNILVNAVQAIEGTGNISIKTTFENGHVLVVIEDTGCGIPEDELGRIFDPFFTTKDNGTGLGLSIAYDIIKNHNGQILVKSSVGEGTTFTIRIPAARDQS